MSRALPNPVRLAAAAVLAAAALITAGATVAPEAEAATKFQTITSLNLGQNLASNLSGKAVTTKASTSTVQQWSSFSREAPGAAKTASGRPSS